MRFCIVTMEVPRSSTKTNSDFSIERLLGDSSMTDREELVAEPPDWLCCTRYRPPRLPRTPQQSNSCRPRRSGRHARVPFTGAQAAALEAAYARAPYLAPPALRALATALQLRDDRIKIWFQNRRARERREKSTVLVPPHTVTLPPTSVPQTIFPRSSNWYLQTKESFKLDEFTKDNRPLTNYENNGNTERPETPLDIESID